MLIEDYIPEAIKMVSSWDIPDEELAEAVNAQAKQMAGLPPDDPWEDAH